MDKPGISPLPHPLALEKKIQLDLLRLDAIHPMLSGNKGYKLRYNLEQAKREGYTRLLSFGGAYSNHLHALAYAGMRAGLTTIGLVRGEPHQNNTLDDCRRWGMDLHFISRSEYKHKTAEPFLQEWQQRFPDAFFIPEGGNSEAGIKGCEEILDDRHQAYTHIACAVGTGATLAGISRTAQAHQQVLGFPAFTFYEQFALEFQQMTPRQNTRFIPGYAMGGFAKRNPVLETFIETFEQDFGIELDAVYTAKMVWGLLEEIRANRIPPGSSILLIHTGGLQGNRSWRITQPVKNTEEQEI